MAHLGYSHHSSIFVGGSDGEGRLTQPVVPEVPADDKVLPDPVSQLLRHPVAFPQPRCHQHPFIPTPSS
jgi:hypothetical protein